ncbi:MAG: hypothetical protein LBL67_04795 [Coriobacteriales bacterium]|jgi:5-formyltetrahydrofolate cyclo-ligase|nr:hypothetical protein [Coriobacteriales bacterium]
MSYARFDPLLLCQEKQELRRWLIARRDALPFVRRQAKAEEVCARLYARLKGLARPNPRLLIAVYAAMGSEVALDSLIARAYQAGWRLAFPCMTKVIEPAPGQIGAATQMCFREVGRSAYEQGGVPFITQPLRSCRVDQADLGRFPLLSPLDFDLVVAPLVGFDSVGNRLGYGGGNYDRLLALLQDGGSAAPVIGAAFSEQAVEHIPCGPHDRPLDEIVAA